MVRTHVNAFGENGSHMVWLEIPFKPSSGRGDVTRLSLVSDFGYRNAVFDAIKGILEPFRPASDIPNVSIMQVRKDEKRSCLEIHDTYIL